MVRWNTNIILQYILSVALTMNVKWNKYFNELLQFINRCYATDQKYPFGDYEMSFMWNSYIWVEHQINSTDDDIIATMTNFVKNSSNELYLIGFILSGFVNIEKCQILSEFEQFLKMGNGRKISGFKYSKLPEVAKIFKRAYTTGNEDKELQKCLVSIADFKYKMYVCTMKYPSRHVLIARERDNILKRLGSINNMWKMSLTRMRYKSTRIEWMNFYKSDMIELFRKRELTCDIDEIIKILLFMMKSFMLLNPQKRIELYDKLCFHNYNYKHHLFEMNCENSRLQWKNFIESNDFIYYIDFFGNPTFPPDAVFEEKKRKREFDDEEYFISRRLKGIKKNQKKSLAKRSVVEVDCVSNDDELLTTDDDISLVGCVDDEFLIDDDDKECYAFLHEALCNVDLPFMDVN